MTASTRLFRSPWPYLFGLALFLNESWHEFRPHAHPPLPPWHPLFNGIALTFAEVFCMCLMFSLVRSTSDPLEEAALALLTITFALSTVIDVHALAHFHTPLPSFRLVFLCISTLLALLTGLRFIQVLREPSSLAPSLTTNH